MKTFRQYWEEICKNETQRRAVESEQNTVVIAGPGSGKTRIVSTKAALLHLQERGVACISFGNPTEQRIRDQLLDMGIREHESLYVGTVHGFCLQYILRPFINIVDSDWQSDFSIASMDYQVPEMLNKAKDQMKYSGRMNQQNLQRLQRMITANEVVNNTLDIRLVKHYEKLMLEEKLADFEMMIRWSVNAVDRYQVVKSYLQHHFEWIIIDEYQDLGGGLHYLAKLLIRKVGMKLLAVGDPNQLIFEFNGSDKKYLAELASPASGLQFQVLQTEICYRFGAKLIAASAGALGKYNLPYTPDPTIVKTDGDIELYRGEGTREVNQLTDFIADTLLPDLFKSYEIDDRIAILYPRGGQIVDELRKSLQKANYKFADERDSRLPGSPTINWLRKCADWVLAYRDKNTRILNLFPELVHEYEIMMRDAGYSYDQENDPAYLENHLLNTLKESLTHELDALEWLRAMLSRLKLMRILEISGNKKGDLRDLTEIEAQISGLSLGEIGHTALDQRIVLTTIHSSKGQEYDCVVLIGAQEGELPWRNRTSHTSFKNRMYVACTRAKKALSIVYADNLHIYTAYNEWEHFPPSPYLKSIRQSLKKSGF